MNHFARFSSLALAVAVATSGVVACSSSSSESNGTSATTTSTTTGGGGGGTGSGGSTSAGGSGGGETSTAGGAGGGGGSGATGGGGGAAQNTQSFAIKAADGGTVSFEGLTAEIPPGALAADTTIQVTVTDAAGEPDAANVLSKVYDLEPNGTQFSKDVKLTIDLDPSTIPQGKSAAIAYLDGGKWVTLAGSAVGAKSVTSTTTHFTKFAIVVIGAPGAGCAGLPFAACGGDPVGTWTFSNACFEVTKNPYDQYCQGTSFGIELEITGSLTFGADATYTPNITTLSTTKIVLPKACVIVPNGDCSQIDKNDPYVDDGANCVQTKVGAPSTKTNPGTWTSNGNTLTITTNGQTEGLDYCVKGNTLMLQALATGGLEGYANYELTK
jgi:hypothetical protein